MNEHTILFGNGEIIIDFRGNVLEIKGVDVPPAEMPVTFDVMEYYRNVSSALPDRLSCDQIGYTTEGGISKYPTRINAPATPVAATPRHVNPSELPGRLSRDQIVLAVVNQLDLRCDESTKRNLTIWLIASSIALLEASPQSSAAIVADLPADQIVSMVDEAAEALADWLESQASLPPDKPRYSTVLPMNSATARSLIDRIASHFNS
jgi:hypothetical protein